MFLRRMAVITAAAAVILAACSTTASPGASAGASAGGGTACLIGVSWNDYDQERWKKADEPAMKAAIAAAGGTYTRTDAKKSSEQQLTDIDNLLGQGVGAIILLSKDTQVIQPALDRAAQAGVPVIAYDRLIEGDNIFYITFDNKKVGTIMGEEILKAAPAGNYAIILGDATDANAAFLRSGMTEAGVPALGDMSGPVHVVFEQNTPDWSTEGARNNMETALNANNNDIQAVLAENDGMATGAVQALQAVGLTDVPISGQDGDKAALNRVALGTQTVSVWKNAFALGQTAGSAAMQLCNGTALKDVKAPSDLPAAAAPADLNAVEFTTPGGKKVWSITLNPQPLKKDNVHDAIDAGWETQAVVCAGVPAGTVTGCP